MAVSKFSKPAAAAPAARPGGKFGARPAPEPAPEEEAEPEREAAPQRGRFGRSANAPAGAAGPRGRGKVHVPGRGRFTGLRSKEAKPPWLEEGHHTLEVVKTFESLKPGTGTRTHIQLKISSTDNPTHREGETRSVKYNTDERAFGATAGAIFMFARAAAGFADDESFLEAVGEEGADDLIDALNGNKEAEKAICPLNGKPWGENPLAGCIIHCIGSKGNVSDNGVQFYEFDWYPEDAF